MTVNNAPFPMRTSVLLLAIVWLILFVFRVAGPLDLMHQDRDQEKVAAYVVDIVANGQWLCQHEMFMHSIMSKPPLFNWLAAIASLPAGEVTRLTLALPSGLSVLVTTLMILWAGTRYFAAGVGFWAAMFYLLSNTSYRQLALIRTDALFSCLVFAALVLAFEAWRRGQARCWLYFWVICTLAALTKGPLGILLAAGGLLAVLWEWRNNPESRPRLDESFFGAHLAGILVCVVVNGGWFLAAWASEGDAFYQRLVERELIGHVSGEFGEVTFFSERTIRPITYVLSRFLPWSLLALVGLWRVFRHPSEISDTRKFERLLTAYLLFGLAVFCAASHKRMELYYPLLPVVALLAGYGWTRTAVTQRLPQRATAAAITVAGVMLFGITEFYVRVNHEDHIKAKAAIEMAAYLKKHGGADVPFQTFFAPYTVQFELGIMRPTVTLVEARALLSGDAPAYLLTVDPVPFESDANNTVHHVHVTEVEGQPFLYLLGNRPLIEAR